MLNADHWSDEPEEGSLWEALDRAHRTLDQVQEWGQFGFWDIDLRSSDLYWSTPVFEILGLDEPSLDSFLDRVQTDDLPLVRQVLRRATEQPGPYRVEHRFLRGDDVRVLSHRFQSVSGRDGAPARLLGVVTDVSHVRALEAELEASIAVRNIGLAASSLLHDFKNQLAIVLGHCKLALDAVDAGRPPMREGLEAIQRAATQGAELTRQVLDLGRGPVGAARPTQGGPVLERVAALARPIVGRGNAVAVEVDEGAGPVLVDADRLEHVLVDLVLNAADAMGRSGGSLVLRYEEVSVSADGDAGLGVAAGHYGRFRVADDGSGMDEAVRNQAARAFFTTKARGEGTGIGLTSVDAFVRASGGAMHIDSAPGAGTTVDIVLPLADARTTSPPPVRVVVRIDDRAHRRAVIQHLEQDGIQAVVADSWSAVDPYLRTEPIDAVVVDQPPHDHDLADAAVPILTVGAGGAADVAAAVRSRVPLRR